MNLPKISLIVPVYRNPDWVKDAVESALKQSWNHFEILLIDDGSPDGCGALCDELEQTDPRIRVFHQKNKGVSAARNMGLEQASGEYVCFLDSDDLLEENHIQVLAETAMKYEADIVSSRLLFYNADGSVPPLENKMSVVSFTVREAIEMMHREDERFNGYLLNKLIRREVLSGVVFDETIAIHEDMLFLWDVLLNCERIVSVDCYTYHYLFHGSSAMNQSYSVRNDSAITASFGMLGRMERNFPQSKTLALKSLLFSVLSVANKRASSRCLDSESYADLRKIIRTHHTDDAFKLIVGTENRISYRLLRYGRIPFLIWKKVLPFLRRFI